MSFSHVYNYAEYTVIHWWCTVHTGTCEPILGGAYVMFAQNIDWCSHWMNGGRDDSIVQGHRFYFSIYIANCKSIFNLTPTWRVCFLFLTVPFITEMHFNFFYFWKFAMNQWCDSNLIFGSFHETNCVEYRFLCLNVLIVVIFFLN